MPEHWLYALLAAAAISLSSWVGVLLLGFNLQRIRSISRWLVAFGIGALLGDVFLHLIPESYHQASTSTSLGSAHPVGLLVLMGILFFYLLDAWLRSPHRHTHAHPEGAGVSSQARAVPMLLIGDGIHNFLDGLLISVAFLTDPHIGVATALAILLHELPQEIGDFGILVYSGMPVRRALWYNFYSALLAVAGAVLGLSLGESGLHFAEYMLPVAAGNFLYLSLATLVPLLQARKRFSRALPEFLVICLGVALMWGLEVALSHSHSVGHTH